jgi:ABC-2 type transport system permease protein
VLVLGLMIVGTDGALTVGLALRFGITLAAYLLYFFFFITVSVIISAYSASSRNSLLKLLSLWIFVCVILPKATANVGATIFRAPSGFEFREAIKKDEENGIDGHNPTDKRFEALKKELMAKYKVDSVEQMPINFDAVAMQEGEKYSSMVYNQHFENLETIYQQQNAVSAYSSLLNPYMAVRNLSMGLAGSDYKTALDFQKQAETYRFSMVELLNNHMRDFSKTGDWDKTADPEIYARLPDFEYQNPSIGQVLGQNQAGLLSLLVWTVILGTAINGLKNKKLF